MVLAAAGGSSFSFSCSAAAVTTVRSSTTAAAAAVVATTTAAADPRSAQHFCGGALPLRFGIGEKAQKTKLGAELVLLRVMIIMYAGLSVCGFPAGREQIALCVIPQPAYKTPSAPSHTGRSDPNNRPRSRLPVLPFLRWWRSRNVHRCAQKRSKGR